METGYKPSPVLPSNTNLSFDEIYQLLRKEEGINYTAKRDGSDPDGNPLYTIGIGHQIQKGEDLFNRTITEEEAILLFQKDITKILDDINKKVKVDLNKNQQLAVISLRYRIGPNYFNESTFLKELNKRNFQKASEEFKNWRISDGKINDGLVQRAERERVRFLTPVLFTGLYTPPTIPPLGSSNFPFNTPSYPVTKGKPSTPVPKPLYKQVPYFPYFLPNF